MEGSPGVLVWWGILIGISLANLVLWTLVAGKTLRDERAADPGTARARRRHLALSAIFALGCAFRSVLPRAEAARICLLESAVSSATITRSVATVAELCFAAQSALLLADAARAKGDRFAAVVARLIVPFIAMAEIFSWYSALTANYLGSVLEESTWALTATLIVLALLRLFRRFDGFRRAVLTTFLVAAGAYVLFMSRVDVPMYWARWRAGEARGRRYFSLAEGWRDAGSRSVVTRRWEDWVEEMPWMTLYFSVGVWFSIGCVRAPRFQGEGPGPLAVVERRFDPETS